MLLEAIEGHVSSLSLFLFFCLLLPHEGVLGDFHRLALRQRKR